MPGRTVCRANECLLALYMLLITISSVFLYVTHSKLILAGIIVVLFVVYFVISHFILGWLAQREFRMREDHAKSGTMPVFLLSALACLVVLMVWFVAYCPGSFEEDNISQYGQALTGKYDSWHPIWHTILFYTLPLKITGRASGIVLFQMICFSLGVGYMCATLYRYAGPVYTAVIFALVVLNPFTGYILLYPFKDVAFAIMGVVAMCMAVRMSIPGMGAGLTGTARAGDRAGRWYSCLLLGFVLANATLFRYNGVLFTGMLLIALLFNVHRRQWLMIVAGFALTMIMVRGPVYHLVDAEISGTEVVQTVGLPMSVIGNAVKETPDLIDQEITEFAYSYAPKEVWEERYARGNFNLMKYGGVHNPGVVEETGALKITAMAARCFVQSPQASFDALFALTDFVYGLDIQDKADIDIMHSDIIDNDYGIAYAGFEGLAGVLERFARAYKLGGWNFIRKLGFGILVLIAVILSHLKWTSAVSWKRVILCLPILAYDFGTMLLLSGHDARFFYISFLVCPVVVAAGMYAIPDKGTIENVS